MPRAKASAIPHLPVRLPREGAWPELVRFSREAAGHDLLVSTCGNASLRLPEGRMAITSSGCQLAHLTNRHIAVVDLTTGESTGARPSSEWEVHRQIYLTRPAVGAVLHCQTRAATLLACSESRPTNLDFIPEMPAYVGGHAYVPYLRPGTRELADSVAEALRDPRNTVVQLTNHGQVVVGQDVDTVLRRAIFFERACWLAVQGRPLTLIPRAEAEHLARTYGSP